MKILVIGGNRYFGKRTVARLISEGHHVTLLNRQTQDDGFDKSVMRIKCDRRDARAMETAVAGCQWDLIYDQVCFEARDARAACNIFRNRTSRYIFTSSQSVYNLGIDLSEKVFDAENYQFSEDVSSATDYAEAKRQCEAVFFAQNNFDVMTIRFPLVLGPDDYTNRLKWHLDRIRRGEPLFFPCPSALMSSIHSNDASLVLSALASRFVSGALNVCSARPIKISRILEIIEEVVMKKAKLTNHSDESNHSPIGFENDWSMSAEKLSSLGLEVPEIETWLPELVRQLAD